MRRDDTIRKIVQKRRRAVAVGTGLKPGTSWAGEHLLKQAGRQGCRRYKKKKAVLIAQDGL